MTNQDCSVLSFYTVLLYDQRRQKHLYLVKIPLKYMTIQMEECFSLICFVQ